MIVGIVVSIIFLINSLMKRLTITEFVDRSNIIHNDKFDYSRAEYVDNSTKIIIICKIHGEFCQSPSMHLCGNGCALCSGNKRDTKENFVNISNIKHNNRYVYQKVNYINRATPIIITCTVHGDFLQKPREHIQGNGCSKCSNTERLTTKRFIEKANIKHNRRYSYDKTIYKSSIEKVIITCLLHEDFYQSPAMHLFGNGCPKCYKVDKVKKNKEVFIQNANIIHNNYYIYDNVIYITGKKKVSIECPKHGIFMQTPNSHVNGNGCPTCSSSKGELLIVKYLKDNNFRYEIQYTFDDCKNINKLKFDNAVFDNENLICVIEYQGQQHYFPVKRSKTHTDAKVLEEFENTKLKDQIKKEYCIKNNIKLIEIPYWEKHNIKKILDGFLRIK